MWNLETLQCIQTLTEHTSVVMSLLCWDQFLLSCSLDKTIKVFAILMLIIYIFLWGQVIKLYRFYLFLQVWFATDSGNLEVTYTHNEEHVCFSLSPNLVFLFYSCSILTCDLESGCQYFWY